MIFTKILFRTLPGRAVEVADHPVSLDLDSQRDHVVGDPSDLVSEDLDLRGSLPSQLFSGLYPSLDFADGPAFDSE